MEFYTLSFVLLLVACGLTMYIFRDSDDSSSVKPADGSYLPSDAKDQIQNNSKDGPASPIAQKKSYIKFRNNYLLVYLLMMTADWLQGPYVYSLYKSYGYGLEDISVLFIAGFFSSAFFGTIISSFADRYGRKLMCILFVFVYVSSCFTKLSANFQVLLLGRLLGGVATSLLFSVFEAWMVSEHHKRGFDESWVSMTFSWATFGNGLVAIASGVIANAAVDLSSSYIAPFMMSAVFLVIGGIIVFRTWPENYGEKGVSLKEAKFSLIEGLKLVAKDIRILSTGVIVSFFEGSMYTFVFLWGPVLEKGDSALPFGLIFASFMVCIMIGSVVFRVALRNGMCVERIIQPVLVVAAISLSIPIVNGNNYAAFWAFNLFELCCGVYFPTAGTIRSKYIPEQTRATVMNIFRIPLNLIVVFVLLRVSQWSPEFIFGICACLLVIALMSSSVLIKNKPLS